MKVLALLLVLVGVAVATHDKQEKTCNEKPESGMCMAYFEKYYFDVESRTCKKFVYGGCQGNGNRYNTEDECLQNCAAAQKSEVDLCSLEAETGLCKAYVPSYFFNTKTGKCEQFIYGGCGGNGNRFATEAACYNKCSAQKSEVDLCSLEAQTGPCKAYIPSYFFNTKTGKCEQFIYGGCGGNGNRFATENACYNKCSAQKSEVDLCSLKAETGPCKAYIPSYFFNTETGKCEQFIYGGCGGNGNRFATEDACHNKCSAQKSEVDLCSMEAETGPCKAYIPSYFFNTNTGKCERFIYGGCGGNANRFTTEAACYNKCSDVCSLEAETGLCRAHMPRYFFNSKTGKCDNFVYGGCGGNGNNFQTLDECQNTCSHKSPNVCSLEAETGMCRGSFPMYYFDSKSGECKEFIYGGCQGNDNRFATKEACYKSCSAIWQASDNCSQDADSGPCKGLFPKYFFNTKTGVCEEFAYGGCKGNGNRYDTYKQCADSCGAP